MAWLVAAPMAVYALFTVAAFVWVMSVSLKTNPELFSTSPWSLPRDPQFSNYPMAWNSAGIGDFLINSALVSVGSVVVVVAVSAMAAYALGRIPFRGSGLVYVVLLSGVAIPGFLVVVPLYFLLRDLGLLGTLAGLGLVYVATMIPFNVYVLTPYFRSLPLELEEAAMIDGAGPARTFFSVMLPISVPGLTAAASLSFLNIYNEFFFGLVFLSDPKTWTVSVGLYQLSVAATFGSQWVQLFAGLAIGMVPTVVVFALAQRRIAEGLTAGAIKG
jgi:ABC-type glycerol-3-phosphate transport system permease component